SNKLETVEVTGAGNVITTVTKNGTKIAFAKGITAMTQDTSDARYVHQVEGKDLSTNDYSNADKNKVNNLNSYVTSGSFAQDANNAAITLNIKDPVTDNNSNQVLTINKATSTTAGVMSAADKTKLDGLSNYDDSTITQDITNIKANKLETIEVTGTGNVITAATKNGTKIAFAKGITAMTQDTSDARYVHQVEGKDLSTNDYSNADKNKVDNLNSYVTSGSFTQDANNAAITLNIKDPVTDNNSNQVLTINKATTTTAGVMSAADKTKLDAALTASNLEDTLAYWYENDENNSSTTCLTGGNRNVIESLRSKFKRCIAKPYGDDAALISYCSESHSKKWPDNTDIVYTGRNQENMMVHFPKYYHKTIERSPG